jgi:hypothetical protein|tara:strand:+ start:2361 stop:2561 length:201 start_codon:yes stop_codon:yes gene_type:complete
MPNLNGKKYSYDAAGMAQYKEDLAGMQMMKKGKEVYKTGSEVKNKPLYRMGGGVCKTYKGLPMKKK